MPIYEIKYHKYHKGFLDQQATSFVDACNIQSAIKHVHETSSKYIETVSAKLRDDIPKVEESEFILKP